jgi:hypothetical protein
MVTALYHFVFWPTATRPEDRSSVAFPLRSSQMNNAAREPGQIEYSDQRGAERIEAALRADGDMVPREIRMRLEGRIREYRERRPPLNLDSPTGRAEHTMRLFSEIEAQDILRSN